MIAARGEPTASMTARTSSIRVSRLGDARDAVGHTGAALVEEDEAAERGESRQEVRVGGTRHAELDVRHPPLDVDEVERAVAHDRVGDVDVAAARVAGLGRH